jgi:hypothetical protein
MLIRLEGLKTGFQVADLPVEVSGLEPLTSALQGQRSTN